jgi:uncharacterized protein (DUF2336 family)
LGAVQSNVLLSLARSREPADRERLLLAVVDLCELAGPSGDSRSRSKTLIDDIFMTLVVDAEREMRRRLAERIADAAWAPKALIHVLALDDIEIAMPIIAASPLLDDADLVRLLVEATLEHQTAIARRRGIGEAVSQAILDTDEPSLLAALADNTSAVLPANGMQRLVEASRLMPGLRTPLVRHPQMTEELASTLYTWIGDALRDALVERFRLDPDALGPVLTDAVNDTLGDPLGHDPQGMRTEERTATERRLVEKLDAAEQLRPGYLLRALRENKLTLFEAALAKLADLEIDDLHVAMASDKPELLALACMVAGIDRSVFPTILSRVRDLNQGLPAGGAEADAKALTAFKTVTIREAELAFRQMAQQSAAPI